jgi:Mg-chelatase subunit ChlD
VRAAPWTAAARGAGLAVDATLRAAALRRLAGRFPGGPLRLQVQDLRLKLRSRPADSLVVFLADASDSMGSRARLRAARGAVFTLLEKARLRRLHLALVVFRDRRARVLLQPTASIALARRLLERLPVGGTTPFADGLRRSLELIRSERMKNPRVAATLVILSDGEANVPLLPGGDCRRELFALARLIRGEKITSLVLDARPAAERGRILADLAAALGGRYRRVGRLRANGLGALHALLYDPDGAR